MTARTPQLPDDRARNGDRRTAPGPTVDGGRRPSTRAAHAKEVSR